MVVSAPGSAEGSVITIVEARGRECMGSKDNVSLVFEFITLFSTELAKLVIVPLVGVYEIPELIFATTFPRESVI